jgi:exosortase E/protease (VPEID-CTERM system)
VTQASTATTENPHVSAGLRLRLAILAAAFFAEKIFLNLFVDFGLAQEAQGLGALVRDAQHWGFRFLVAFGAAVALFTHVRGWQDMQGIASRVTASPIRVSWILVHLALVALLAPLSYALYRYTATDLSVACVVILWCAVAAMAGLAALASMASLPLWLEAARALGSIRWYAAIAALLGSGAMQMTQKLWGPTSALTFDLTRRILSPIVPTLTADPVTLVLSTGRFAVQIADMCSGLEGVGLVLAFAGSWLFFFRDEYIFPRALLLIPAGVAAIFGLNVLRIAALILIGDAGFPEVAVYGFHSQAGWIAFIAVACGLVLLSRRSPWLNRTAGHVHPTENTRNPTAVYLMPLLAILAASAISRAFASDFQFLYPLTVVAALLMFTRYRRPLAALDWGWSWRGVAVGVLVYVVWIIAARMFIPEHAMPAKLAAMPAAPRLFWILSRIAGSVLLVPIAEELAYRGFLMRRLMKEDFESVPFKSVSWPALTLTAIVFGAAHGALWIPGVIAGLAFGLLLMRRGRFGEAVAAHVTANALVCFSVLGWAQWQLW